MEAILSWVLLAVGIALLLLVVVDAVITTLAVVEMPGPLTRVLSITLWRGRATSPLAPGADCCEELGRWSRSAWSPPG